jgi:acyl-CoA thioesterase-2
MTERFAELRDLLTLEPIDPNIYRGQNEAGQQGRLFGGQVLAQALAAASATVDALPAHSLHGYFLRPGDPATPVLYTVDRIRDGRSFTTRRVVCIQNGKAIFNLAASFHEPEEGFEHQVVAPEAPDPESLPTWLEQLRKFGDRVPDLASRKARGAPPIDFRFINLPTYLGGEPGPDPNLIWLRAAGTLPDDEVLHRCFLTYASDMSLIDTVIRHHGRRSPLGAPAMAASLDHAIWFHRRFRADEWLLYAQDSPSASGGRGFARGALYAQDGTLVASVAQEGLIRPARAALDVPT